MNSAVHARVHSPNIRTAKVLAQRACMKPSTLCEHRCTQEGMHIAQALTSLHSLWPSAPNGLFSNKA